MRILHILRKAPDDRTKETIKRHSESLGVTVLLIQDGVLTKEEYPGHVLALDEDVQKREVSIDVPRIDYASMVRLIFQHERVVCW